MNQLIIGTVIKLINMISNEINLYYVYSVTENEYELVPLELNSLLLVISKETFNEQYRIIDESDETWLNLDLDYADYAD